MIPVSVAPMMDRTDRHFRWFLRRITRRTLLYTEMVTANAIRHGDRDRLLGYHPDEHPISLQLGGDDPALLAESARIAADMGYDEVNLNVGCPSDRVQKGRFGACLMAHPDVVADAVAAMRAVVSIPVTVKHRIGIDDLDRYEDMLAFVDTVAAAGCERFTVHARKAWLTGLSPKENRTIPPLRYGEVHRLKAERPHLQIELNGGIRTVGEVQEHLGRVDAVMIGRAAYDDPWLFAAVEREVFGEVPPSADRFEAALAVIPYVQELERRGEPPWWLLRHLIELFHGQPGARTWKRALSEAGRGGNAGTIEAAVATLRQAAHRGAA